MHRVIQEADQLRKKRGLTYDRVADLVGKDRASVVRQLSSESNPTISTICDYESALGGELHFVELEICNILQAGSLDELRIKALSQHDQIQRLESELELQKDLAERRLSHCHDLDAQIAMLNEQINEKDSQITMLIKHFTKE